jgi:hypothetical protein
MSRSRSGRTSCSASFNIRTVTALDVTPEQPRSACFWLRPDTSETWPDSILRPGVLPLVRLAYVERGASTKSERCLRNSLSFRIVTGYRAKALSSRCGLWSWRVTQSRLQPYLCFAFQYHPK